MNELNLNEMEMAVGGSGGSKKKLPARSGCDVYRIGKGDTLAKIARKKHTTVAKIKALNPTISDVNDITAGYYIYIPEQGGIGTAASCGIG